MIILNTISTSYTSSNSYLNNIDLKDNIHLINTNVFHDRYIILDSSTVYHLGTSINHAGSKTFSVNILTDEFIISSLLNYTVEIISKGGSNE